MREDPWSRGWWWACVALIALGAMSAAACERPELVEEEPEELTAAEAREEAESTGPYGAYEEAEPVDPSAAGPPAPAVYFTSGLHGYTEPCGCTADVLLGGIDRITAFVLDSMELHPAAVKIDSGDWVFEHAEVPEHFIPQETAKASVLATAHRRMGTVFSVPGIRDLALGVEFYQERMAEAGMFPLAANLSLNGDGQQGSHAVELDGTTVLFVGAVDPGLYEEIEGAEAGDPVGAVQRALQGQEADVVVLVLQATPERSVELLGEISGVDFVVVGQEPRRGVEAELQGSAQMMEAYTQGRYVGRLKLYAGAAPRPFVDGRSATSEDREILRAQIELVEQDLRLLELRTSGERTPLVERMEERLEELEDRLKALVNEGVEIPEEGRAFLYDLVPMEPGYRLDQELREARLAYNRSLAELNRDLQREVIPVEEGEPFFIGTAECTVCHVPANDFWETTRHSQAVATLEERDKQYDQNCIGCHVVGWEEPGGSVLGQIVYEAELGGRTFTKDLNNVGCESCHGPGSNHRLAPITSEGVAQNIIAQPREVQCTQCHVPEHSPRFDFDVYVQEITGPGHEFRGP